MMPLERGIWDDLFSAAFQNIIFAFFNAANFSSFSPMLCSFPCFAIKYATLYDAVRIGLSISTKLKTGRVAFLSNLALFILNSASVVFQYFLSACTFRNCYFSFAGVKQQLLNLA